MRTEEAHRIRTIAASDGAFGGIPASILDAAEARLAAAGSVDRFRLEAMRLMALGGNGHSRAIANEAVRVAPLRFVWLADGPWLIEGTQARSRLVAVNGVAPSEIVTALRPWLAGTDQRARVLAGFMLAWKPAVELATGTRGPPRYSLANPDGNILELQPETAVQAETIYPAREPGIEVVPLGETVRRLG